MRFGVTCSPITATGCRDDAKGKDINVHGWLMYPVDEPVRLTGCKIIGRLMNRLSGFFNGDRQIVLLINARRRTITLTLLEGDTLHRSGARLHAVTN